jgi:hypothetical protein
MPHLKKIELEEIGIDDFPNQMGSKPYFNKL